MCTFADAYVDMSRCRRPLLPFYCDCAPLCRLISLFGQSAAGHGVSVWSLLLTALLALGQQQQAWAGWAAGDRSDYSQQGHGPPEQAQGWCLLACPLFLLLLAIQRGLGEKEAGPQSTRGMVLDRFGRPLLADVVLLAEAAVAGAVRGTKRQARRAPARAARAGASGRERALF